MIPVLTPAETKRLDLAAGDRLPALMEAAGHAVAMSILRRGFTYGCRAVVLAGPGNNGGDAYVAARHLLRFGVGVRVIQLASPRSELAATAEASARAAGVGVQPWSGPIEADLVVDGLFGVGFTRALPANVLPWVDHAAPLVAIDIPSGVDAATGAVANRAFSADWTVALHAPKPGHLVGSGPDHAGFVEVADIGMSGGEPELLWWTAADSVAATRSRRAHKWSAGSVLVVGGSPGLAGAPVLTGIGALHAGAGAVAIAHPGGLAVPTPSSLLSRPLGTGSRFDAAAAEAIVQASSRYDVLALGPGLGPGQEAFVQVLVEEWERPLILDADGINALDLSALETRKAPTILTPHGGEFLRLTSEAPSPDAAAELAAGTNAVVLLKGGPTYVASTGVTKVVTTGGPELATIGTGDVLTGMVAALLARGLGPSEAAASAAYWHGVAGKRVSARGILTADGLATEIASVVPNVV